MNEIVKINDGFVLSNIAEDYIVVPSGQNIVDFKVMLTLNDTGAFLWEKLSKGIKIEDLVAEFIQEYDVDIAVAREDIEEFLIKLKENNFIE